MDYRIYRTRKTGIGEMECEEKKLSDRLRKWLKEKRNPVHWKNTGDAHLNRYH